MDLLDQAEVDKDREAKAIVKRGHATLKELIILNYGEWPLRGLDIVTDEHLDQKVLIAPMRRFVKKLFTEPGPSFLQRAGNILRGTKAAFKDIALATRSNDREIYLNKIRIKIAFLRYGDRITNHLLAHERRHVHQFDYEIQNRRQGLYGTFVSGSNLSADAAVDKLIADSLKDMGTLRRTWIKFESRAAEKMNTIIGSRSDKFYYREGVEIQARLEELLVQGYPHWPRMPLNREELYAAMMDAGFEPPASFMRTLATTPAFAEARDHFHSEAFQTLGAPPGLFRAIRELPSEKAREQFWQETLPTLYADILESFGDKEGRARMGLGINMVLPFLLLGKDYDRCHQQGFGKDLDKRIAHKVQHLKDPSFAAGMIHAHFERKEQERQTAGQADLTEGDKRFILAFVEAPGIKEVLIKHQSPLAAWLDDTAFQRPPPPASSPPSLHA